MKSKLATFMNEVLGKEAIEALAKAEGSYPGIFNAVPLRSVLGWVKALPDGTGEVVDAPGSDVGVCRWGDRHEVFVKGELAVPNLDQASAAAVVAVALGIQPLPAGEVSPAWAAKLGKNIDAMASHRLRKAWSGWKPKVKAPEAHGPAAEPKEPLGPMPPTAPSMGATKKAKGPSPALPKGAMLPKVGNVGPAGNKLPGAPKVKVAKGFTFKMKKSEAASARCSACGGSMFQGLKFVGCSCMADMAKSVKSCEVAGHVKLQFGSSWDRGDALALVWGRRG